MKKYKLLTDTYTDLIQGEIYPEDYQERPEQFPVGRLVKAFPHEWQEVKVSKQDFRIVQTSPEQFHVERKVVETKTAWFRTKEVVTWKRCDERGDIYSKVSCTRGYYYLHPVPPQKPFTSLEDAERRIELIIDLVNNFPKIHEPKKQATAS